MLPLRFSPLLKRIRWGGRRLGTVLGKALGPHADYAESWELADYGADQTVVAGGPWAGWTLGRLVAEQGRDLLGDDGPRTRFPLLIKFLDACDRLSVQVHPNEAQARRTHPDEGGKTEALVVIDVVPGSVVYSGLRAGVTRGDLQTALAAGRVAECLHAVAVAPGDCLYFPAGAVHAIGEGVLAAEVQQTSNVTYRLHDWGRLGTDGRPRELHLREAFECFDFTLGPLDPLVPQLLAGGPDAVRRERLVVSPYFEIERWTAAAPFTPGRPGRFRILMVLAGNGLLACPGLETPCRAGDVWLLPASTPPVRCLPHTSLVMLEAGLPSDNLESQR